MRGAEWEGALAAMDRRTDIGHLALDEGLEIGSFAQLCNRHRRTLPEATLPACGAHSGGQDTAL